MKPVILFRDVGADQQEIEAIKNAGFVFSTSRLDVRPFDLIVCRYSCLPFFQELEAEVERLGGTLLNSYTQHRYVADLKNWYTDLYDLTAETWFRPSDVPKNAGPFILKGETNSKKFLFNTHMFAETWEDMIEVHCRLQDDGLVGSQDIYVRKFIPLQTYFTSLHGLPITKEFRFFVCCKELLSGGFYWSSMIKDMKLKGFEIPDIKEVPEDLINKIIDRVGNSINFYAFDVAQKADGNWLLVELNDGMMSGLSENNSDVLYKNLYRVLEKNYKFTNLTEELPHWKGEQK